MLFRQGLPRCTCSGSSIGAVGITCRAYRLGGDSPVHRSRVRASVSPWGDPHNPDTADPYGRRIPVGGGDPRGPPRIPRIPRVASKIPAVQFGILVANALRKYYGGRDDPLGAPGVSWGKSMVGWSFADDGCNPSRDQNGAWVGWASLNCSIALELDQFLPPGHPNPPANGAKAAFATNFQSNFTRRRGKWTKVGGGTKPEGKYQLGHLNYVPDPLIAVMADAEAMPAGSVMPGVAPMPLPLLAVWARPETDGKVVPTTEVGPSPSPSPGPVGGGVGPPSPPLLPHVLRPPGRNEREKKAYLSGATGVVARVINAVTEATDVTNCGYRQLTSTQKKRARAVGGHGGNPIARAIAFAHAWPSFTIDQMENFLLCVLQEQGQDKIIGGLNRAGVRELRNSIGPGSRVYIVHGGRKASGAIRIGF